MASIKKNGGVWRARISYKVGKGKYTQKTKSGFKTKKDAEIWANEFENEKYNGIINNRNGLFSELYQSWYETFKEPQLEDNSKSTYKQGLNLIEKYFDGVELSEMTSAKFQSAINDYGSNHVMITVSKVKNVIQQFVIYAVDEDYIPKDFTRNVKAYSGKDSKDRKLKFLEADEIERLKEEAVKNDDVSSYMIIVGLYTGARYSEVACLTKDDIDLDNKTITINKSWQQNGQKIKSTKTNSSNRVVSVPDSFVEIARKWNLSEHFAFISKGDVPPSNNAVNQKLCKLLIKANCHPITFHDLRHTQASYLLANDVAIQYVSERLGHSNVNITLRTYAHLLKSKRTKEENKTLKLLDSL